MRSILLAIILLAFSSVCFAQDAVTQATPEYKEEASEKKVDEFIQKAIDCAVREDFKGAYEEYKNVSEIQKTQLGEKYLRLLEGILNGKIEKELYAVHVLIERDYTISNGF